MKKFKNFKKNADEAMSFLKSCFDENNEDDGKTFKERVKERLPSIDKEIQAIIKRSIDWDDK